MLSRQIFFSFVKEENNQILRGYFSQKHRAVPWAYIKGYYKKNTPTNIAESHYNNAEDILHYTILHSL